MLCLYIHPLHTFLLVASSNESYMGLYLNWMLFTELRNWRLRVRVSDSLSHNHRFRLDYKSTMVYRKSPDSDGIQVKPWVRDTPLIPSPTWQTPQAQTPCPRELPFSPDTVGSLFKAPLSYLINKLSRTLVSVLIDERSQKLALALLRRLKVWESVRNVMMWEALQLALINYGRITHKKAKTQANSSIPGVCSMKSQGRVSSDFVWV